MAESKEKLKSLLMKVKEESEKVGLKLQKTKIMASGPITTWEIDGQTLETLSDFIFLGSNITADGDCSHEITRYLILGRKAKTSVDSILKSRGIISTKWQTSQGGTGLISVINQMADYLGRHSIIIGVNQKQTSLLVLA